MTALLFVCFVICVNVFARGARVGLTTSKATAIATCWCTQTLGFRLEDRWAVEAVEVVEASSDSDVDVFLTRALKKQPQPRTKKRTWERNPTPGFTSLHVYCPLRHNEAETDTIVAGLPSGGSCHEEGEQAVNFSQSRRQAARSGSDFRPRGSETLLTERPRIGFAFTPSLSGFLRR